MAEACYFTGCKTKSGNNRSHVMNSTKRAARPNLQKVHVMADGKPKKVWVSTRVLKSGKAECVQLNDTWTIQVMNGFLSNKNS